MVPGDNYPSMIFEIEEANVEGSLTGGFQMANLQLFNLTSFSMTGLRLKIELAVVKDANQTEYWQLVGASEIDFVDLQFATDS